MKAHYHDGFWQPMDTSAIKTTSMNYGIITKLHGKFGHENRASGKISPSLTGHTGFKGGWLALWLSLLGAKVHGFHYPLKKSILFIKTNLAEKLKTNCLGDVRDIKQVKNFFYKAKPRNCFPSSRQPLVRKSYECLWIPF